MDVTITNLGSTAPDDDVYLSGPAVSLAAGASMIWSGVTTADLDAAMWLKTLVLNSKVSVSAALTSEDGAQAVQGTMRPGELPRYTFANLPSGANAKEGMVAYCTNGRKNGEGGGSGTGVPVYYADGSWRTYGADAAVTS